MVEQKKKCLLPRPKNLKGLHYVQTRNHILTAIGLCFVTVSAMYYKNTFRKTDYAEFYA